MSDIIISVLFASVFTFGTVTWIDWINRRKMKWSLRNPQHNNSEWEFIKHILRRHGR
jgi:hypothetical protein